MKGINNLTDRVKKHPFVTLFVTLAAIASFIATCTYSPEKISSRSYKYPSPVEKKDLLGTWVSEQWPEQKHIFTDVEVKYKELKYSVILAGSGTYNLEPDGTVEWTITWYSGNFTNWKGMLEGEKITVEFENSWDGSHGADTLTRVQPPN